MLATVPHPQWLEDLSHYRIKVFFFMVLSRTYLLVIMVVQNHCQYRILSSSMRVWCCSGYVTVQLLLYILSISIILNGKIAIITSLFLFQMLWLTVKPQSDIIFRMQNLTSGLCWPFLCSIPMAIVMTVLLSSHQSMDLIAFSLRHLTSSVFCCVISYLFFKVMCEFRQILI